MKTWIVAGMLGLSASSFAEVSWHAVQPVPVYELQPFQLLRLKKEMGKEAYQALSPIRGHQFQEKETLTSELKQRLTAETYEQFAARLLDISKTDSYQIGYEILRPDVIALHARRVGQTTEEPGLTGRSWLKALSVLDSVAEESKQRLTVDTVERCFEVTDAKLSSTLLRFCPAPIHNSGTDAFVQLKAIEQLVGLGQEFSEVGSTTVERLGDERHGRNVMEGFNKGANGNTLIPMAYALGENKQFGLFLDNRFPQNWALDEQPAKLSVSDGEFVLYVVAGDSLAQLRQKFMALSGNPLVPPKSAFGFWLSEYGFDDWAELDAKLADIRQADIPISGAVLDLQWFGGVQARDSQMGSLTWDREKFAAPEAKITAYKRQGIELMLIEEAYVDHALSSFDDLGPKGFLAHDGKGQPISTRGWWGKGGMIDYTQAAAGAYWHDNYRQALVDDGIIGHWTDLGEPETLAAEWRYGASGELGNEAINNSFNVEWIRSIYEGYQRNEVKQRPFIMSRSGGTGIQRFGAAMWSGDIGSDFGSLAQQMPQQTHMMWSGIDYYGSDIGGFHRQALNSTGHDRDEAMNELYTQWLAYAALFEVPVRAHTFNLCNCKETSPTLIGDLASNRASLNLRYELIPYLYSLAHLAHQSAEPVFPSLSYYYQQDQNTWELGHQKMIGPFLTAAAVAEVGAEQVSVYLPQGEWFDYRTGLGFSSTGESLTFPLYSNEMLQLPVFARDGAIVPIAEENSYALKVYGQSESEFIWSDDDGKTTAYLDGQLFQTKVTLNDAGLTLQFEPDSPRPERVIWSLAETPKRVSVNGRAVELNLQAGVLIVDLSEYHTSDVVRIKLD